MRRLLSVCFLALFVSGCGLEGPAPQESKNAATPETSPAAAAPSAAGNAAEKSAARTRGRTPSRGGAAAAQEKNSAPLAGNTDSSVDRPFLDKTYSAPAGMEWTTDITSRRGGTIRFHVASQGSFGVTVVIDRAYQALKNNDEKGLQKQDVLLMRDSQGFEMDGMVAVPAGRSWFIIENRAGKPVDFHLKCYEVKE